MQDLDAFRLYYNRTIHPELLRLERQRRRLLLLIALSAALLFAMLLLEFYIDLLLINIFISIGIGIYVGFLLSRVARFRQQFKPRVVNLVLDFIGERQFRYEGKGKILPAIFHKSQIFASSADLYKGEDYISGQLGETPFEMCELNVREHARVRERLQYVFRGLFVHATFKRPFRGKLVLLPAEFRQYLQRSIKALTLQRAKKIQPEVPGFADKFLVYATDDAERYTVLSRDIQAMLLDYRTRTDKPIYLSFIEGHMYVGITEHKDILEPQLFRSNVSFELVRSFFEDIRVALSIVEAFDQNN